jgi:hypothetical protein
MKGRFGRWTILSGPLKGLAETASASMTHYRCRCDCGTVKYVRAQHLFDGKTKGCRKAGCRPGKPLGKACGDLRASIWSHICRGARCRRYDVTLTQEQAWRLFQRQRGRCALTGLPLVLKAPGSSTSASLDRIDSREPYCLGNVQWLHKDVNLMKRDFSTERFLELCSAVVRYQPSRDAAGRRTSRTRVRSGTARRTLPNRCEAF